MTTKGLLMRLFVLTISLICWCGCQVLLADEPQAAPSGAEAAQDDAANAEADKADAATAEPAEDDSEAKEDAHAEGNSHANDDSHQEADSHGGDAAHDGDAHDHAAHGGDAHDDAAHGGDAHDDAAHGSGAHGAHAHDPNATNPLVVDPDLAIATGIVFVLLFVVLSKFAWGPIVEALDNREQSVANKIDEANKNFAKAQEQLALYEKKIAAAAEESRVMLDTARKDAEAVAAKVRAEAEEDAKRQRERALADIEAAKNAALRDISEKSADIAVSLAGKIVRREVKSADHAELIRGALDKMPSSN